MDKALVYSTPEVDMILPKRLLLLGAAPVAIAAMYGGSVAFAQSSEPTPSTTPQQTTPATPTDPTTPGTPSSPRDAHSSADCPNMGGSGGSGGTSDSSQDSGSTTQTRFAPRGARSSSVAY